MANLETSDGFVDLFPSHTSTNHDSRDSSQNSFPFRSADDRTATIDPFLLHNYGRSLPADVSCDFSGSSPSALNSQAGFTNYDSFGAQPSDSLSSFEPLPIEEYQQIFAFSTQDDAIAESSLVHQDQPDLQSLEHPSLPNVPSSNPSQAFSMQSDRHSPESGFPTFDIIATHSGEHPGEPQLYSDPSAAPEFHQPNPFSCANDGFSFNSTLKLHTQHGLQSQERPSISTFPDHEDLSLQVNVDLSAVSNPGVQDNNIFKPQIELIASSDCSDHLDNSSPWYGGFLVESNSLMIGAKDSQSHTQCFLLDPEKDENGSRSRHLQLKMMRYKPRQIPPSYEVSQTGTAVPFSEVNEFQSDSSGVAMHGYNMQTLSDNPPQSDRFKVRKRKQSPNTPGLSDFPPPCSSHFLQPSLTYRNPKRRSVFSAQRREEVGHVRAIGACLRCRYLGIRVSRFTYY